MQTKKWYQSKIVLISLATVGVFGFNLLASFLGKSGISPDQLAQINAAYPDIADKVNKLVNGFNLADLIGLGSALAVLISRLFFTTKLLPQSVK